MAKVTRAAVLNRVKKVQSLLLGGHTRSFILQYGAEEWQLAERQMDDYIQTATAEIDEINRASVERNMALITSNLWSLYRRHLKKDPGPARQILMDLARLRGLDKAEITVHVREHKDASDEELAKALGAPNG